MSGECEKCGEHTLDCICKYDLCKKCGMVVYRIDKFFMNCLKEKAKRLVKLMENKDEKENECQEN